MVERSLSEIRALCTKAARGAGYSWGVAEEAGVAAKWLHKQGCMGADHVTALLTAMERRDAANAPYALPTEITSSPVPKCSVSLGCLLSDRGSIGDGTATEQEGEEVCFPNVVEPMLLLPFLHSLTGPNDAFEISVSGQMVRVDTTGLHGTWKDVPCGQTADIKIFAVAAKPADNTPVVATIMVRTFSASSLKVLEGFASRTYVPDSEESRARGAG